MRRQLGPAFLDQPLQFDGGIGMLGVDGDDLPQALFALGVGGGDGGQPDPGVLVARFGNEHKVKHLARFVRQAALCRENGLAKQFFGTHERVCQSNQSKQRLTA